MDIGGGILTREEIDEALEVRPELDTIRVSGLRQDTFEHFVSRYGKRFRRIHFFKNKLVEDWSALEELSRLECLYWFHNQRIQSLWNLSNNAALAALHISDFTRLHDLSGIEKAKSLRMLFVGDSIWNAMTLQSLAPLADMDLEYLMWSGKHIFDQDLSFLPTLKRLKVFDCATNAFTTEQMAWVAANCPGVEGYALKAYQESELSGGKTAFIIGKRKPALLIEGNEERIRRYEERFEMLKQQMAGVPYREAFPEYFSK